MDSAPPLYFLFELSDSSGNCSPDKVSRSTTTGWRARPAWPKPTGWIEAAARRGHIAGVNNIATCDSPEALILLDQIELEHDPEKCAAVFGKDHAKSKN
jgi:hypothetical protein